MARQLAPLIGTRVALGIPVSQTLLQSIEGQIEAVRPPFVRLRDLDGGGSECAESAVPRRRVSDERQHADLHVVRRERERRDELRPPGRPDRPAPATLL